MDTKSEESKEINISYETLFELLRREKGRDALQKLSSTFYFDVADYVKAKKQIMKNKMQDLDNYSEEEIKKTEVQIININKIIRELYDKRERKIITMAVSKCRVGTDMAEASSLLDVEKRFYDELVMTLKKNRCSILAGVLEFRDNSESLKLFPGCLAENGKSASDGSNGSVVNAGISLNSGSENIENIVYEEDNTAAARVTVHNQMHSNITGREFEVERRSNGMHDSNAASDNTESKEKNVMVRFVQAVPRFLGKDLSEFGPYEEDDIATLPEQIAKILINKQKVEEIKSA